MVEHSFHALIVGIQISLLADFIVNCKIIKDYLVFIQINSNALTIFVLRYSYSYTVDMKYKEQFKKMHFYTWKDIYRNRLGSKRIYGGIGLYISIPP